MRWYFLCLALHTLRRPAVVFDEGGLSQSTGNFERLYARAKRHNDARFLVFSYCVAVLVNDQSLADKKSYKRFV